MNSGAVSGATSGLHPGDSPNVTLTTGPAGDALDRSRLHSAPFCPVCGAPDGRPIAPAVPTIHPRAADRFTLRECGSCRHWWIDPLPDQAYLGDLYAAGSEFVVPGRYTGTATLEGREAARIDALVRSLLAAGGPDAEPEPRPAIRGGKGEWHAAGRSAPVKATKPGFRVIPGDSQGEWPAPGRACSRPAFLEIGVGSGNVFRAFQRAGADCFGVEPGGWTLPDPQVVPSLDRLPAGRRFDVIVVQDVLEHLTDPVAMLADLRRRANPGARLLCGFPCNDSLAARLGGRHWAMVRPIGHLHFFSGTSLRLAFERGGWQVRGCRRLRRAARTLSDLVNGWAAQVRMDQPVRSLVRAMRACLDIFIHLDQWRVLAIPDSAVTERTTP